MLIDRTGQKFSAKAKFAEKCQLVVYEIFHSKQLGFDTVLPNPRQDSKRNCISGRPTPGLGTLGMASLKAGVPNGTASGLGMLGAPAEMILDMLQIERSLYLSQLGNSLKLPELVMRCGKSQ